MPFDQDDNIKRVIPFLLPVSILVAILLHWQSLNGGFLSDTYAIYISCYNLQQEGFLWKNLFSMFWQGLSNGSVDVYRPLGFLTLCGEFSLFGNSPFTLKSIQLLLHIFNALILYVLVKTVFHKNRNAEITAIFSAIFFLFSPVTPEVSMWIAARHDSLAHLFILLSCLFHWQNKKGLTVLSVALALCSKESAIVLPAMLFVMSYFKENNENQVANFLSSFLDTLKQTWAYWLIFVLYLILRVILFEDAMHVYQQQHSFMQSLTYNMTVFFKVFSNKTLAAWSGTYIYSIFWLVFYLFIVFSLMVSIKKGILRQWLVFFAWIIITLFALTTQIGNTDSSGAGARVLYTVSAWFAVVVAMPLLFLKTLRLYFYLLLTVFLIYVQNLPIQQWTKASLVSKQLLSSLEDIEPLKSKNQWDLVLIPEHIGVGLLGRTAQGGFSMPPFRTKNTLNEMIPFVKSDLETWRLRLNNNFMSDYKKNVENPDQFPKRYFCSNKSGGLEEVSIINEDLQSSDKWLNKWKQQTSKLDCYL